MINFKEKKICEETFDEQTEMLTSREVEMKVFDDEEEVGYLQLFEKYDDEGDCEWLYLSTIQIYEAFRNQGRGTRVLRKLAEKYGVVYVCPSDDGNARLYERLGEEVAYRHVPHSLLGCYDNYGKMYRIEK